MIFLDRWTRNGAMAGAGGGLLILFVAITDDYLDPKWLATPRGIVEALLAFVGIAVTVGAIGGLLLAAAPHRSQYRGRTETTGIEARPPYPSFTQT